MTRWLHSTVLVRLDFFLFVLTNMYAVVAGQTSVKAPEKDAFERYLPEDVHIVLLKCYYETGIYDNKAIIRDRASNEAQLLVEA